jgi:hypothetical protein
LKIAKNYRLNEETLDQLNEIINYWSVELLQTPNQNRKTSATAMIEFLIQQEYLRINSNDFEKLLKPLKGDK